MQNLLLTNASLKSNLKFNTMKRSKILFIAGKSNSEETRIKEGSCKSYKLILLIFMLSWITLFSSCFIHVSGRSGEGSMNGRQGHHKQHVPSERHGNGGRHR